MINDAAAWATIGTFIFICGLVCGLVTNFQKTINFIVAISSLIAIFYIIYWTYRGYCLLF